jgi:AcrR family transcriptional regulator
MARWPTDTRARLQAAATELYAEQGYDRTTIAAIVRRAGLTERTFYRHFGDKREVLFANEGALTQRLEEAVAAQPDGATMREAIDAGVGAVVEALQPRRDELVRREPIVASQPELQERERMKLATWTTALSGALVARGEDEATSVLAAEVAIAVLRVAAGRWLAGSAEGELAVVLRDVGEELRALV